MLEGSCHCGSVTWRFDGIPASATACNCTVCRRYGVLWAYDYEGERIAVAGATNVYMRRGDSPLGFHFCATCGCIAYWRSAQPGDRRRIAVNLRLSADPDAVANVVVDHFDGLGTWRDLPRDGRCVRDLWF